MKARRSAKVAFIASVLAATPVAGALPAYGQALTGTCSTGTEATNRIITLNGSGSSTLSGTASGSTNSLIVNGSAAGFTGAVPDNVAGSTSLLNISGNAVSFSSSLAGTQSMSSWSQAWTGDGSAQTDIALNT